MSKIYEPKGRAREYSPLALNPFKGCEHKCAYCYVPSMLGAYSYYNHENIVINPNYADIEQSAKRLKGVNKQILLSFTSDPYTVSENGQMRTILEILNKYGHYVAILTKSGEKVLRDVDLFKKFNGRIKIGQTLTFSKNDYSLKWEAGAALPHERISALKYLSECGILTWASFEPTIIPEQSLELLKAVTPFISHVKIGKINNFRDIDKKIDWADYLQKAVNVCRESETDFYIKHDLRAFNKGTYLSESEQDMDFHNVENITKPAEPLKLF